MRASNIAGYGIFYGYKPLSDLRIQVAGIYYLYDSKISDTQHTIENYTIGLELQKDIMQNENNRVYLMAGGYYYYDNDEEKDATPLQIINNSYNYGVGVGYEYFFRRITLGAELGYKLYTDERVRTEHGGELPEYVREAKLGAGITLGFIF
jgi:hypothetical protein